MKKIIISTLLLILAIATVYGFAVLFIDFFVEDDGLQDSLKSQFEYESAHCTASKCFDTTEERDAYVVGSEVCKENNKQCEYACIDSVLPVEDCLTRCELKNTKCWDVLDTK